MAGKRGEPERVIEFTIPDGLTFVDFNISLLMFPNFSLLGLN
jgi:hypothetical protein